MYRITLGNNTIYDPRIPEYFLEDPELHQKANKVGTLSFRVYPTHAQYGQFVKLASVISVYKGSQPLPMWRGRVLSTVMRKDKSVAIECEDLLAYLLDSIVRPFDFSGSVAEFLAYVLTQHNNQVTVDQKIQLGTVTVVDPNDYIHRSSVDYLSSWEVIESRLIKLLGGYLRLRHESDGMYLDYLAGTQEDLPTAINVIEYGENLTDLTEEIDAGETYTACIPLGAKLSSDDGIGGQNQTRLTVASVNDGVDYIVNEEALARYGWICAPISKTTWDDVTLPANLLTKARAFLDGQGVKLKNTLTLKAIDQDFDFLEHVRVKSTPHNISAIYLLTEKKTPLADPEGATITLGDSSLRLSDTTLSSFKDAIDRIETVSGTVDQNNAQTNAEINELAQTALLLQSNMERTAQELISQMSATYTSTSSFEEYKEAVSTQFTQSATAFSLQFDKLISQINTLNGDSNQQFSEIRKYIRFEDGNIELGRSDSALILRITSDRISFLLNNVELAYFSSGRLYVENLEAIRTLTVGNFTYLPRENGNLSLKTINPNIALARWNGSTTLVWDDLGYSTPDESVAVMAVWDGASTFRWNSMSTDAVWNGVEETTYHQVLIAFDRKLHVEYESGDIAEGDSFTATITALPGYTIGSVTVKMGGVDISATAYADGIIYIPHVTGFVAIGASSNRVEGSATLGSAVIGVMKLGEA